MKVLIAGLCTETNTFSPMPTGWGLWRHHQLTRTATQEVPTCFSAPLHEWRRLAEARGWEVFESLMASAEPAGLTPRAIYEELRDEILREVAEQMPDIFLISMHGAMVADGYDDCEGDMMERARAILGPDRVIGMELDPHNHLTPQMLENATLIVNYKEYPHIDSAERAVELFAMAADAAEGRTQPVMTAYDCKMVTYMPTLSGVGIQYVADMKAAEARPGVLSVSLTHCFPFADVPHHGMKTLVITDGDAALGAQVAQEFGAKLWALRHDLFAPLPDNRTALARVAAASAGPLVLADLADNPGGGTASDSSYFLREVLDMGLKDIALGMFWDPILVEMCHDAGLGARLKVRIGGKMSEFSGDPVDLEVTVRGLGKDQTQLFGTATSRLGDTAWLEADGVHIVVNAVRAQCFHPSIFTDLGLDITQMKALIVKSTNHFYAGFAPIATEVIRVNGPGMIPPNFGDIAYTKRDMNYFPRVQDPFAMAEPA